MTRSIQLPQHAARAVAWAASLGAVTAETLAAREQVSVASARGCLVGAERRGALRAWRPLRERPALYTVTAAGLRAVGLADARPSRVSAASAQHAIACCEVAVALGRRYPTSRIAGEPELRAAGRPSSALHADPIALCTVPIRGRGALDRHRADLAVLPSRGLGPMAVEVELTVKAPRRLLAICTAWARSRDVAGVLYVVTPVVRPALERALTAARADSRIALADLDELLSAAGAPFGSSVTSTP